MSNKLTSDCIAVDTNVFKNGSRLFKRVISTHF